jgi:vancomycin resistance protein VanJ
MDSLRRRRATLWLTGNAPRSGFRVGTRRLVPIDLLALLCVLLVASISLVLHTVADRWWPATILLFLGRWPWLIPVTLVLPLALLLRQKRAAMIAAAAGVLGLFGVMELSLGLGRFAGKSEESTRVRVITFNVDGNAPAPMQLAGLVAEWQPDILAVQECGDQIRDELSALNDYQRDLGTTCLLTRFRIVSVDSLRRENFMNAGGAAWVKRYRLSTPTGEIDFTNIHLDTPRKAFEALMDGKRGATDTITLKTDVREVESRLTRRLVDRGRGPRLVAGDFNMPTESAIFRQHWSSMTDAFKRAGFGFGYTRLAGWIRLRIDHVLTDDNWVVKSARVLPDYGSDHLPVMVDVEKRRR